jgi:hypothetical protein
MVLKVAKALKPGAHLLVVTGRLGDGRTATKTVPVRFR